MSNKMTGQEPAFEIEDLELNRALDLLQDKYQKHTGEVPDVAIDRQILAAAHREILAPNKKTLLKNSLWRKFSLPLYASATFAFTAFAIHVLLPTPARVPPGTSSGPVSIDVINESATELVNEPRKKLLVPEVEAFQDLPKLPSTELELLNNPGENGIRQLDNNNPILFDFQLEGNVSAEDELFNGDLNANKIEQNVFLDKDLWAREIINLFKSGKHHKAHSELKRFKKIYPDFPIDEQIEAFKQ